MAENNNVLSWYLEIPVVTRVYLTLSLLCSAAVSLELVSPLSLYFSADLVLRKGQYWRPLSCFLYLGPVSLELLLHTFFLGRHFALLEGGRFRGRRADLLFLLLLALLLLPASVALVKPLAKVKLLSHSLSTLLTYVWARDPANSGARVSLLGVVSFRAPFLPLALLVFSLCLGSPVSQDLLGLFWAHLYHFFEDVYPKVAAARGWTNRKILVTPGVLKYICNPHHNNVVNVVVHEDERN